MLKFPLHSPARQSRCASCSNADVVSIELSPHERYLQEARAADRVDLAVALTEAVLIPAMFANSTPMLVELHRRAVVQL